MRNNRHNKPWRTNRHKLTNLIPVSLQPRRWAHIKRSTAMKILAIFHLFVIVPASCCAATVLAEHILPATASSWFNVGAGMGTDGRVYDNRQAQTFTTTSSGFLESISFNAYRFATTNADLRVSVTSVIGGQPRTILESLVISPNSISTQSLTSAFLRGGNFSNTISASGNVLLQANTQYAIVFSTASVEANYRLYGDYSAYSGGTSLSFQDSGPYQSSGGDLLFRVAANPIPEPESVAMCLISTVALITRRHRSRTIKGAAKS